MSMTLYCKFDELAVWRNVNIRCALFRGRSFARFQNGWQCNKSWPSDKYWLSGLEIDIWSKFSTAVFGMFVLNFILLIHLCQVGWKIKNMHESRRLRDDSCQSQFDPGWSVRRHFPKRRQSPFQETVSSSGDKSLSFGSFKLFQFICASIGTLCPYTETITKWGDCLHFGRFVVVVLTVMYAKKDKKFVNFVKYLTDNLTSRTKR